MDSRHAWPAVAAIGVAYLLIRIGAFFIEPETHDFYIYYHAAEVAEADLSPYLPANLRAASDGLVSLPFVYPPYTTALFTPFTALEPRPAARIYLALKTLALAALIGLWISFLPNGRRTLGLAIIVGFVAVGFHEAAIRDLKWGNVSTFEQVLLWAGFAAFVKERYYAFSLLVLSASLFKLAPIAFLATLLFVPGRKGWPPLACGALVFGAVHGLSYAAGPAEYESFLSQATAISERGAINPSTLAAFRDLFGSPLAEGGYLVTAITVLGLYVRRVWARRSDWRPLDLLVGATLAFALAAPRMKDYSYMLLIFPAAWLILDVAERSRGLAWGLGLLVVVGFFAYQSLALALVFFVWWYRTEPRTVSAWRAAEP